MKSNINSLITDYLKLSNGGFMSTVLTVGDVMTPDPYSIDINEDVIAARTFMQRYDIRHLAVSEDGKIVGILSDRDIQFALGWNSEKQNLTIRNLFTGDPYTVGISTPLQVVAQSMWEDHIGSALVVQNERVVGIFTAMDACRELARSLRMH